MKIKKRNIELAVDVCVVMFIVLVYIHFAEEDELLFLGYKIEEMLHIQTDISVIKMQSFIEIIVSGILGSTVVAMFFYVQDYQCEREKMLISAMDFVNKFCKIYSDIPFCRYFESTEYAKLARSYYIEYYNNELLREMKKTTDSYLRTIAKSARRVLKSEIENKKMIETHEAKLELEKYLKEVCKDMNEDSCKECIDDETNTIIKEIDYKIEKSVTAYKQIMEIDLSEYNNLIESVTSFKSYGLFKKLFLKKNLLDAEILPQLYISVKDLWREQRRHIKEQRGIYGKLLAAYRVWNEYKCNTENTLKRIVRILQRTQKYTYTQFSIHNYSGLKKYNKQEMLTLLRILQKSFIEEDEVQIIPDSKPITFSYNKVVYSVVNLKMILLYELTERYEYRIKSSFAMVKDAYENNQHVWSKTYSGDDLRTNFFRI
ncbi:hypothetical protein [Lacrimispora sp.]|uniref:hypothetical protein n=1 Tax=Lacrimispora sp. TaxID=2719234 RepID=UPI0028AAFD9E|nr:hypothetical protein [Lacrimispora sp.]